MLPVKAELRWVFAVHTSCIWCGIWAPNRFEVVWGPQASFLLPRFPPPFQDPSIGGVLVGSEFSELQEPQTMNPGALEAKAGSSVQLLMPPVHIPMPVKR